MVSDDGEGKILFIKTIYWDCRCTKYSLNIKYLIKMNMVIFDTTGFWICQIAKLIVELIFKRDF